MHRELLDLPSGQRLEDDHRNGDGLDNRRANLRVTTKAQNQQNLRGARRSSKSGIRGVHPCKQTGRWIAQARIDGERHWLGRHDSMEAAEAVVVAFRRAHMEFSEMDR